MNTEEKRPFIGVGVIVVRDGKILMGKRIAAHGENTWGFPGGNLEFGETVEDCASRELEEETSLKAEGFSRAPYTNDIFTEENKHYITLFVKATVRNGDPKIIEPDKCLEWRWCNWNNLPKPLFLPIENLRKNYPNFNPTQITHK